MPSSFNIVVRQTILLTSSEYLILRWVRGVVVLFRHIFLYDTLPTFLVPQLPLIIRSPTVFLPRPLTPSREMKVWFCFLSQKNLVHTYGLFVPYHLCTYPYRCHIDFLIWGQKLVFQFVPLRIIRGTLNIVQERCSIFVNTSSISLRVQQLKLSRNRNENYIFYSIKHSESFMICTQPLLY